MDNEFYYKIAFERNIGSFEHVFSLYLNPKFSDIRFEFDEGVLHAHKAIISSKSSYFEALIKYSNGNSVPIKCTNLVIFREFLRYMYTGVFDLDVPDLDTFLHILDLAQQYLLTDLYMSIVEHMYTFISFQSVYDLLNVAKLFEIDQLRERCCKFLEHNANEILSNSGFRKLTQTSIMSLLKRDTFGLPEKKIFQILLEWRRDNEDIGNKALECVRFTNMSENEICTEVLPQTCRQHKSKFGKIIAEIQGREVLRTRRNLPVVQENVNLNVIQNGAKCITGKTSIDVGRYKIHQCLVSDEKGITFDLGAEYLINYVSFLFPKRKKHQRRRNYDCYYVKVSADYNNWITIVDYSSYHCIGVQELYFAPEVVKYVRIASANQFTINMVFRISHVIVCYKTNKVMTMVNGIAVIPPNSSLDSLDTRLLSGNYSPNKDELTPHSYISKFIHIRLGQPHRLSKITFTLDPSVKYTILTSVDYHTWELVKDKRYVPKSSLDSYQSLQFPERTVVFIQIQPYFSYYEKFRIKSLRLS